MKIHYTRNKKISSIFLALAIAASFTSVPSASAANTGYRYWGYFHGAPGANTWTASMTSAAVDVADGAVEGWAFTYSDDDIPDASAPRIAPDFKRICGKTKAVAGKKRIGIYIDFGPSALRPPGETLPKNVTRCVVTENASQGIDVLGAAVKIRAEASGLICGLNSYPAKECGAQIKTPLKYRSKK